MKDHRINRKKRHPLENIIAITISAIICNAETWEEVSFFGEDKQKFFSKFFLYKSSIFSTFYYQSMRCFSVNLYFFM